jgi:peptidoglycan/xylan/chitin deacetylase (PgdA/CDA1 family)
VVLATLCLVLAPAVPAHARRALDAQDGLGASSAIRHADFVPDALARSQPLPGAPALAAWARPVPILMYHVVASPPPNAPYPGLFVSRRQFAQEMQLLAREGYRPVTLSRLLAGWQGRATLPRRPVVLTFDDGYRSVFTTAAPVLRHHGWPGVLDLALSHLGPRRDLTADMVRRLIHSGWEIASHTMTHPDLATLDAAHQWYEVDRSRTILERDFGVRVNFFCYPSGRYDAQTLRDAHRAGYLGSLTTRPGLADPTGSLYTLARVRVAAGESLAQFALSLRSGYLG